MTDATFYRTPEAAIAAPPERLAYVAAFDPAGRMNDAMTVIDCDDASPTYGTVVGWNELPHAGNELHHFGWNACSSALCHEGHAGHLERRYLLVPCLRSSRTYVLDTQPDPRAPQVVRTIEADELAKAGYSRPHTLHCGPDAIFMSALGGAHGEDAPEALPCSTTKPSTSSGHGSSIAATSTSLTTCGGTSTTTPSSRRSGPRRR